MCSVYNAVEKNSVCSLMSVYANTTTNTTTKYKMYTNTKIYNSFAGNPSLHTQSITNININLKKLTNSQSPQKF